MGYEGRLLLSTIAKFCRKVEEVEGFDGCVPEIKSKVLGFFLAVSKVWHVINEASSFRSCDGGAKFAFDQVPLVL